MAHDPTTRTVLACAKVERYGNAYLDLCAIRWTFESQQRVHHACLSLSHAARSSLPAKRRLPEGFPDGGDREEEIAGLIDFIDADPIIVHGLAEYKNRLPELGGVPWICTQGLSQRIWPEAPAHDLASLREWLELRPFYNDDPNIQPQWDALVVGTLFERCLYALHMTDNELKKLVSYRGR